MAGVKHMQSFNSNKLVCQTFGAIHISICWVRISGMIVGDGEGLNLLCLSMLFGHGRWCRVAGHPCNRRALRAPSRENLVDGSPRATCNSTPRRTEGFPIVRGADVRFRVRIDRNFATLEFVCPTGVLSRCNGTFPI